MNTTELFKLLRKNPNVASSIPMEAQMGYPVYTMDENKLCVNIFFHFSKQENQSIVQYHPRYIISAIYPFEKIIRFEDLLFAKRYSKEVFSAPLEIISIDSMKEKLFVEQMKNLFLASDHILEGFQKNNIVSSTELGKYRKDLENILHPALKKLYQEEI